MAMRIRLCGAERITQYSRSKATLDATGPRIGNAPADAMVMVIDFWP